MTWPAIASSSHRWNVIPARRAASEAISRVLVAFAVLHAILCRSCPRAFGESLRPQAARSAQSFRPHGEGTVKRRPKLDRGCSPQSCDINLSNFQLHSRFREPYWFRIAQGRANQEGANPTAPTEGEIMSRISSLKQASSATDELELQVAPPEGQADMTISQMSRLYGVSLRTLRFYEDRGLIKPRREGNARYYRGADRVRLDMILKGKKLGFTLSEIHDLIGGDGANETPDLEEQLQPQQIVNQIGHLERQRQEIESAIERLRATHDRLVHGAAA
jgi:DNA-binding transcriptional MerR regulator